MTNPIDKAAQPEALRLADEQERLLLEIANGERKVAKLPIEPFVRGYAELRRLHAELATQAAQIEAYRAEASRVKVPHETIIDAARRSMDEGEDAIDTINVPSHHAAALSLALDDYDAAMKEKTP